MVVTIGEVTALAEAKYGVIMLLERGLSTDELVDGVPNELVATLCSRMNPRIYGTSLLPWETRLRSRAREVALSGTGPYPAWYADERHYVEVGVLDYAHVTKTGAALWCVVKSLRHDCVLDLDRFHPLGSASYILSRTHAMLVEGVIHRLGEIVEKGSVSENDVLSNLSVGGFLLRGDGVMGLGQLSEDLRTATQHVARSIILTHRYGGPNDACDIIPLMELLWPSGEGYVRAELDEVLPWANAYLRNCRDDERMPTVVVGNDRLGVERTVRWMLLRGSR